MSIEKKQNPDDFEKHRLIELAGELDAIQTQKKGEHGDVVMQKLIQRLRDGDAHSARIFLSNEADKFSEYREDAIPLIIEKLYGGSGSPWFTVERKLKAAQAGDKPESSK